MKIELETKNNIYNVMTAGQAKVERIVRCYT